MIGDPNEVMITRRRRQNEINHLCYVSLAESKNAKQALEDENWIEAIQEELEQFERNDVWMLVPRLEIST